ncbi:chloride channel protein [Avrilella dinanensis]|uniref:Chloride channel protein n=1 Tax=Avrilella dinanensis TaxID=2008672 RepID=A0A2M9R4N9_9FLAO|nr:chloride channel protein [Avrilella dinanensis]PJR03828.1 chloride channel protein [Avrilella dinanensis]
MKRKKITYQNYLKLILTSIVVSLCSVLLVYATKHLTEHIEHLIYQKAESNLKFLYIFLPTIGITSIYFLRKYLFKGKKNKGITEIYKTLDHRKDHLPAFKIPSHLINGFLTVIFGGSTGIEVSSVVASATAGNIVYKQKLSAQLFKRELICAGVTAAVAVLFTSPLAGFLFSIEVISGKVRKSLIVSCAVAALVSWIFIVKFDNISILPFSVQQWNWYALPLFAALSIMGGGVSVYFTLLVTRMKKIFGNINNNFLRVNLGAISVGVLIFLFPVLYGDSYHGLKEVIESPTIPLFTLACLFILKPIAASLTLGAGGDGGVFAPSIVAGAVLGLFFAQFCNVHFGMNLIPLNFALVGACATLSASIYAPFTALILTCNLVPNGYQLFFPLLIGCFSAKYFSKMILPYNLYTYDFYLLNKQSVK